MSSLACGFSVTGRRQRILRAHWTASLTKLERFRFSVGWGAVSKKYLGARIHMHPPLSILVKWKQVLLWWSEYFRLSQHQKYYLSIIVSAYKVLIAFTHFCAVSCNIQFASILTGAGILQFIWTKLWAICEPSPCLFLLRNCCSLVRTLFLLWCHSR